MNRARWIVQYALFFVLACFCVGVMSQQNTETPPQGRLEIRQDALPEIQKILEDAAKHSAVTWVEVRCTSFDMLYLEAHPQEDIGKGKTLYNIQKDRTDLQNLIPALQRTRLKYVFGGSFPIDVRLKVTLYGAEKVRLVSIYMNTYSPYGYINSTPVEFDETPGDLYDWLYKNFPNLDCFKNIYNRDDYKDRQERIRWNRSLQRQRSSSP